MNTMKELQALKKTFIFFLLATFFSMLLCRASIYFNLDHRINVLAYSLGIPVSILILGGFKSISFENIRKSKKWLILATIVPLIYTAALYLLGKYVINFTPDTLNQDYSILYASVMILISAFFEEIGWRGYLYKNLTREGWFKMNLIISVLWATWHLPAIFYGGYAVPSPYWVSMGLFFINLTLASFVLGWIRQKTGGVLAPTLIHASNNIGMVITAISGPIIGETGILLTFLLVAFIITTKAWRPTGFFELQVLKEKYIG